jgi:hypothetical protein
MSFLSNYDHDSTQGPAFIGDIFSEGFTKQKGSSK